MNNITELNLHLHERRQIESDYYIDSFVNLEAEAGTPKKEITGIRKKYQGYGNGRKARAEKGEL